MRAMLGHATAWRAIVVLLLCRTISAPAYCQPANVDPAAQARREASRAAYAAAMDAATAGPAKIPLRDQGTLDLPAGMSFVPTEQGARLLRASGNRPGPSFAVLAMLTFAVRDMLAEMRVGGTR